ncbi:MAG TPA: WYL domain-containing protein, partial [Nocardioides sp.]|uniref:helix-turn-helix transcriptional regulator n=1 Tax=Nocardioides sp. TaxID=35761 RepID=UPI002D7F3037
LLRYRTEAGSVWQLDVEPWAVVVRHGRWYVLGHSHTSDARRAYRVDRVLEVEVLDDTFTPPADLDPVAALEEHLAVGWEYDVEVVIEADVETTGQYLPRALGRLEVQEDGTTLLLGSTSNPRWYAERLAGVPVPFRIVRCPELREAVREIGNRFLVAAEDPGGRP